MKSYKNLLYEILSEGDQIPSGAVLKSTGETISTVSLFGAQWRHDLRKGFPLLTTKRVHWKSVVGELIWFLNGESNVKPLQAMGVSIWDEWADERGELGPVYGAMWRSWERPSLLKESCGEWIDQISNLCLDICAVARNPNDRSARRLILSSWNAALIDEMALPPCHVLAQFALRQGCLSCHVYMRSCDAFLGLPFNIASYGLLTHLLAETTGVHVGDLIFSFGDLHIYHNHLSQVEEQLCRHPKPLPSVSLLVPRGHSLFGLQPDQFRLIGYDSHPAIRGEVAV